MENYRVKQIKKPIDWEVNVPGSKSITNRALLMAALSACPVVLDGVLFSDDSRHFLSSLKSLGYELEIDEKNCSVKVNPCDEPGRIIPEKEGEINVGSAGTAARFLTAMLGSSDGVYTINSSDQMKKRPMKSLFEALLSLGAKVEWLGEEWHLPVKITGACANMENADVPSVLKLDISESTQFLSAFLLIAPMYKNGLKIEITSEKKDGSYIRITRKMMEEFGAKADFDGESYLVEADSSYNIEHYQIEPDMSAACYFYAAAAVTGGKAKVKHVHSDIMQGDLKFLSVLENMGCTRYEEEDGIVICGPEKLSGLTVNMNDFSDQALTLGAIAPYADSPVTITNIGHIRKQESDRINAIVSNLKRAGIKCDETEDSVTIYPGQPNPDGADCHIETFDDHRVAMSFTVLGFKAEGIIIDDPLCCRKTFEKYFEVVDSITSQY